MNFMRNHFKTSWYLGLVFMCCYVLQASDCVNLCVRASTHVTRGSVIPILEAY